MANEIITIGVGAAGCRLASRFLQELARDKKGSDKFLLTSAPTPFFARAGSSGYASARTVLVDPDPRDAGRLRTDLSAAPHVKFHPTSVITQSSSGGGSASRSYGRAREGHIDTRLPAVLNRVAQLASSNLQGFLVFHALAGGTGSGLTAHLVHQLRHHYSKAKVMTVSLLPDYRYDGTPMDPINAALGLSDMRPKVHLSLLADNDALHAHTHSNARSTRDAALVASLVNFGRLIEDGQASPANLVSKLVPRSSMPYVMMAQSVGGASASQLAAGVLKRDSLLASYPSSASTMPWGRALLIWRGVAKGKEISSAQANIGGSKTAPKGAVWGYQVPGKQSVMGKTRTLGLHGFFSHRATADLLTDRVLQPYARLLDHGYFTEWAKKDSISSTALQQAKNRLSASIKDYREQIA